MTSSLTLIMEAVIFLQNVGKLLPDYTAFQKSNFVGSEVLKKVVMKSTIFWDITLATCFSADVLPGLFDPEDGGDMFLQNTG
jgi:hypothetical protein